MLLTFEAELELSNGFVVDCSEVQHAEKLGPVEALGSWLRIPDVPARLLNMLGAPGAVTESACTPGPENEEIWL